MKRLLIGLFMIGTPGLVGAKELDLSGDIDIVLLRTQDFKIVAPSFQVDTELRAMQKGDDGVVRLTANINDREDSPAFLTCEAYGTKAKENGLSELDKQGCNDLKRIMISMLKEFQNELSAEGLYEILVRLGDRRTSVVEIRPYNGSQYMETVLHSFRIDRDKGEWSVDTAKLDKVKQLTAKLEEMPISFN